MKNRKKIWVDVLTPKQALFTKAMIERAPSEVELVVTTRDYSELNKFLAQIKLEHMSFGRHGGGKKEDKLEASIERMRELVPFVSRSGFDCCLSYISPEAARVSFGLGIKHFICSDSPHASATSRLAVPLATKLFSPFPIKKERWTQYGIGPSQVFFYHALDPWAWLLSDQHQRREQQQTTQLGRAQKNHDTTRQERNQDLVLIRLEESFASYLESGRGVSAILSELVRTIKSCGDFEIVIIPRYDEQRDWVRKEFGKVCTVPEGTVDGADLISKADLVIGGGGTMTQEAALLGVPNISYFPSARLDVFENYYFPEKLSVRASTQGELMKQTSEMLSHADLQREIFAQRAELAVRDFEDPVKFVFEKMLEEEQE